jgi:glycerate dehydrogenase
MKIVVLDGYTLNPGDLDWEPVRQLGELTVYDRSAPSEIQERAAGADIVFVNKVILNAETLENLPTLKYIGVMATGFNNVDIVTAKSKGIVVTNVRAYGAASVAQHTFALLLALTNHLELHGQSVMRGEWVTSPDFCYTLTPLTELAGKTMGLVGLGDIGSHVARIARAFDMGVIAYRKNPAQTTDSEIEMVSLDELFERSDVVSLHCPLTEETKGIINSERLATMKSNAILLNTGRGPLINELELAEALEKGTIGGAGLDVLSVEPPSAANPLLSAPNCLITPHIAWASFEARQRLMKMAAENLMAFTAGKPTNVVN